MEKAISNGNLDYLNYKTTLNSSITEITVDTVYDAVYAQTAFTVTFNSDGGKEISPATVEEVIIDAERSCRVVVAPEQLSLAIGKEGQNARLAARLTGFKIDIKTDRG